MPQARLERASPWPPGTCLLSPAPSPDCGGPWASHFPSEPRVLVYRQGCRRCPQRELGFSGVENHWTSKAWPLPALLPTAATGLRPGGCRELEEGRGLSAGLSQSPCRAAAGRGPPPAPPAGPRACSFLWLCSGVNKAFVNSGDQRFLFSEQTREGVSRQRWGGEVRDCHRLPGCTGSMKMPMGSLGEKSAPSAVCKQTLGAGECRAGGVRTGRCCSIGALPTPLPFPLLASPPLPSPPFLSAPKYKPLGPQKEQVAPTLHTAELGRWSTQVAGTNPAKGGAFGHHSSQKVSSAPSAQTPEASWLDSKGAGDG